MKRFRLLFASLFFWLLVSGCDVLQGIAPLPEPTAVPTKTVILPTPSPLPTLGPAEYINAAYCWESHIDEGEYNLIRFFPNGTLIDVFVQPYQSCQEAWEKTESYLTVESQEKFNHGEYHLSGDRIQFTLIQANTTNVIGEVTGDYTGSAMLLTRQGAEEWEYVQVLEVSQ